MTSSITAAPRIVVPSRERRAFSSIRVCAEMLTLVAVRIVPMKRPVQRSGCPNHAETAAPAASGKITPPKAAQNATFPTRRISARSVSRPAMNISRMTPSSARSRTEPSSVPAAGAWTAAVTWLKGGQPSTFSTVGPRMSPARISPKTAGWPTRLAAAAASLAAAMTRARNRHS